MIKVELVYIALDKSCVHLTLSLPLGASVFDALTASKIYDSYPEAKCLPVGIYAKQVALEQVLQEGDRVEIYRPLLLDPKEKRRLKAKNKSIKSN